MINNSKPIKNLDASIVNPAVLDGAGETRLPIVALGTPLYGTETSPVYEVPGVSTEPAGATANVTEDPEEETGAVGVAATGGTDGAGAVPPVLMTLVV